MADSLAESIRLFGRTLAISEGLAMAFDPEVLLPIQYFATGPIDNERARLACRNEQQDDDVLKFADLAHTRPPVAALSVDDPEARHSRRWKELNVPRGRRHELRAAMVDARGWCWGAVCLYRQGPTRFSPADLDAVAQILPGRSSHLAVAMVTARAPGSPAEATSMIVGESGELLEVADGARRWIEAASGGDPLDRVGMLLAAIAARLRRTGAAVVRVRMRSPGGSWTTLLAERLTAQGGSCVRTSVVIMPADSGQLRPLLVAAFDLSPREADVVGLVLRGLDSRSISAHLFISVNTVQDHLKSVFAKTGVRSRRQLAALFTREPDPVP